MGGGNEEVEEGSVWVVVSVKGHGEGGYKENFYFFFSSRRRHTRLVSDWSSDVCSSDLMGHRDDRMSPFGDQTCDALWYPLVRWPYGGHMREIGRASCRERV